MNDSVTESHNPATRNIDTLSPLEIVRLINSEDAKVAAAVGSQQHPIAEAITMITDRMRRGGRLVYIGAGTSGRLGVLDASECPPTFNTDPRQVVGIIAGGPAALTMAMEGAEDKPETAVTDLKAIGFSDSDCLVGIATSGRTPYVIGAVDWAKSIGAATIGLACNDPSDLATRVDVMIAPIVGPEVISGSTRMKAGTATKLVLNTLTTGVMVRLGKTFGHRMVDLRATNAKLVARSKRLVAELTGADPDQIDHLLSRSGGEVKTAIVMHHRGVSADQARELLATAAGQLRQVIGETTSPDRSDE